MQPTALPPPNPSWTDFFQGLSPPLQFVLIVVAGVVVGVLVYQKFFRQLKGDGPKATDFAFGSPTTFADMSSVKKLVENVDLLTVQMMKSSVSNDSVAGHMAKLCDLVGQLLLDLREQREEAELAAARQQGYEEGRRDSDAKRRQQPLRRAGDP